MGCRIAKRPAVYYEYDEYPEFLKLCDCNVFSTLEGVQKFDSRQHFSQSKAFTIRKFGVLLGEYLVGIRMHLRVDDKKIVEEYKGTGKVDKEFTFELADHEHIVGVSVTYTETAISTMQLTTSGDRVFIAESKSGTGPNTKEYDLDLHHKAVVGVKGTHREYLESLAIYAGVRIDLLTDEEIQQHGIIKL